MGKTVFFTMHNFRKEGGGTIRMLGIINELAKVNDEVVLISNIDDQSKVSANVTHLAIDFPFSQDDKRKFQFLLSISGTRAVNKKFASLLERLSTIYKAFDKNDYFIFFEYLDNSVGYWLYKNKVIPGYINDVHGIASNEFDFQTKKTKSIQKKLLFQLKKKISLRLDQKVFSSAAGIFFASNAMKDYFYRKYPILQTKKNIYLPYLLNDQNIALHDPQMVKEIKNKHGLQDADFIFLFAGAFKETGGVQDLIVAFNQIAAKNNHAKLLIIGDGPSFEACKNLVENAEFGKRIFLLGRQPYHLLSSFQDIAQVIICPDRQNLFSDLIVHVKYLDALVSGKVVINGNFKSVQEINQEKKLSLFFTPSDIQDLADKMEYAMLNYAACCEMFKDSKTYTLNNLTYKKYIGHINFNTFKG